MPTDADRALTSADYVSAADTQALRTWFNQYFRDGKCRLDNGFTGSMHGRAVTLHHNGSAHTALTVHDATRWMVAQQRGTRRLQLGNRVAAVTSRLGITPCPGCTNRQIRMNRW
jgi:hypothetical protein